MVVKVVATVVPKVYIETSVWGITVWGQPRALQVPTRRFLARCRAGSFAPFVSSVVFEEIADAPAEDQRQMMDEINRARPVKLAATQEAERLADQYIRIGVLPAKKRDDARHIAVATIAEMDIVVSWNHRHLANQRKKELFNAVNKLAGHDRLLLIHTPFEVL